jgi:putative DNA primase/helicase
VVPLKAEPKGDVSDWLETDPTGARLARECRAAPLWEPTTAEASADDGSHGKVIAELAALSEFAYQKCRKDKAKGLGISLSALDKMVKQHRATAADEEPALPHWKVESWPGDVSGAALLDDLKATFERYIVLPAGAADASALWTLHSWTMDAGDVSPFLVLVSPTKRCGKTSMLILLMYLTPRSELASNISPSALFRYIEDIRPTLLIDEADSFVSDNEEMRGILDSGHTKAAAHVIRNVEINGKLSREDSRLGHRKQLQPLGHWPTHLRTALLFCNYSASQRPPRWLGCVNAIALSLPSCGVKWRGGPR